MSLTPDAAGAPQRGVDIGDSLGEKTRAEPSLPAVREKDVTDHPLGVGD